MPTPSLTSASSSPRPITRIHVSLNARTARRWLAALALCASACHVDLHFSDAGSIDCAREDATAFDRDSVVPSSPSFVERNGSRLLLDGRPFRFAGANLYWLGLDENTGGVEPPTRFRVDDGLDTAVIMGATVVRSMSLGVSVGCTQCVEPALGTFNEAAFAPIDYAIAAAKRRGLRLIIPLVDNYRYFSGGRFTERLDVPVGLGSVGLGSVGAVFGAGVALMTPPRSHHFPWLGVVVLGQIFPTLP